jgi:hypothetical protein
MWSWHIAAARFGGFWWRTLKNEMIISTLLEVSWSTPGSAEVD